ncbi:MAG TPA: membrane protein insertase YidC [Terriglobales bacterium]|nr:membrane protein insertase YidC [Terriglobales bacterium]
MERRLLLAFALTFLVLMVMQPLVSRYVQKPQPPAPETAPAPAATPPAAPAPAVAAQAAPAAPVAGIQAQAESEAVIENDLYRITFTNRGAQVKSWVLKKFQDKPGGQPLELVHTLSAEKYGYPLSLWTYDATLRKKLNEALYVASAGGALTAPADIIFEYADGETSVRKVFRFDHSYVVHVETSVTYKGSLQPAYPAWPSAFGDQHLPAQFAHARIVWQNGGKIERLEPKKVSGGNTLPGPLHWAGVEGQYFGVVFLPDDPGHAALVTLHEGMEIPEDPAKPEGGKKPVPILGAAVGDPRGVTSTRIFVGPKSLDVLGSVHATPLAADLGWAPDLKGLVDFGFFGFIARPLFLWLKWTHDHWVANWGWSILILTVIINVALLPLRLSSMKSALKMQKVAPQIKAVQEKYKKYKFNDPKKQEMNAEIAAIYKREKINPAGGCIPLLLQFPFLIAFYTMLTVAIELRHAPWLWVKDLAAPDPYYLLPIGIVVSMFLVQRITPQAGMDPMQQKMMSVMMPVMLGVISITLSAGLGLYWSAGNVISFVQQILVNRSSFGREMRAEIEKKQQKRKK